MGHTVVLRMPSAVNVASVGKVSRKVTALPSRHDQRPAQLRDVLRRRAERELNGRFIASADTPDGPSLGTGAGAIEAIEAALEPFEGATEDLLASLPRSVGSL